MSSLGDCLQAVGHLMWICLADYFLYLMVDRFTQNFFLSGVESPLKRNRLWRQMCAGLMVLSLAVWHFDHRPVFLWALLSLNLLATWRDELGRLLRSRRPLRTTRMAEETKFASTPPAPPSLPSGFHTAAKESVPMPLGRRPLDHFDSNSSGYGSSSSPAGNPHWRAEHFVVTPITSPSAGIPSNLRLFAGFKTSTPVESIRLNQVDIDSP